MKYICFFLITLLCSSNLVFSQQILVDDSIPLETLIENNLLDGCVDISNISSSVNGNSSGFSSYAFFERAGSNFPFENGIMLSTGAASSGGNSVITPTLNETSTTWGTDPDIEAALGINNTLNATSIEFDFVSISNQFQFNYLLASEEYFGTNPCQFSDGFVFLIREAGSTAPYQNIALIPGTSTPVNTQTIHDEIFGVCPAQNDQFFDGYNVGDTNYNGRTTTLTAAGSITPYVTYHIKLIIADQTDGRSDSAVFIEGNSFKVLDLGEDITTCAGSVTLDADLQNQFAIYTWYLDNNIISGETNPTLNATQSGTYRVEVTVTLNNMNCVEEDDIVIVLNTEEPITPITDYEQCDDMSGDGIETFDLTTKNAELTSNIPFTNFDFSYHFSEAEARSNSSPITTPISNTVSPQPIFVRIEDLDSNCFAFTSFNLIVNAIPNIVTPTDLEFCDNDTTPDGFAVIDLTQKNDEITGGQSNLFVSYHFNPLDVNTGNNPIPTPYVNTNTPSDLVYVRVVNTATGCVNTTMLNVDVTISPIVDRTEMQFLNACDTDLDGNANFDLTEVISEILNGLTGVSTTFHTSRDDAETGNNVIADETNYEYTNAVTEPGFTTIFLRVEDDITGCASVVPFEIHTNLLLTGTDTGDFALCDTNDDSTDTLDFNLNTVEGFIANDLPNITVTFYETEDNRNNNVSPLPKNTLYSAISPQPLYITIDNGACTENSEITLLVNPILLFNPLDPVPYCDTDDDGIVSIDLQSLDDTVTGGNPNFTVSYFLDAMDAQNNNTANQLPPFHTNTSPIETLYARIESDSGCATVNPFQIEVFVAPTTMQPTNIVICDNDQDGLSIINLNNKISETVTSTVGLDIDFFTSFDDANTDSNTIPIAGRATYETNTQTIYIRVEDNISATRCYSIVSFEAIVNTLPIIPSNIEFQICEDDGDSIADFILADKDVEILNGQTGKEVFYFEDAAFTLPIDKNAIYQNTSREQTIYIRVENITDANCFDTSSMTLRVSPDPVYNPIIDYLICDDDTNDGRHEFNLSEKADEIRLGSPDILNISFHLTPQQAENGTPPLPLTYTNTSNPQSIYVRIESDDSLCHVVEELGINIIASPDVTNASPIVNCDADYDGMTTFDLETADFQILDRVQSNLIINYFENLSDINQNDGLDNTNEIITPSNFTSNTQTVYVKVANTLTRCFSIIPIELLVNTPPVFNNINTFAICDNDTNTFNLSIIDNLIVNDTNAVNISYHNSQVDAGNNMAPIGNTFNYTANNHTIFIRLQDSDPTRACTITTSFNLQINPNPIANTTPDVIECDDNFDADDTSEVNLATFKSTTLGSQNSGLYRVLYYNDSNEANALTPAIQPLNEIYQAFNGETIYARIENTNTNCYSVTEFNVVINPLPEIPVADIVPLCLDDLPLIIDVDTGNAGDTYLWSTAVNPTVNNSITSEVVINPTNLGAYSVTVTTASGCPFTRTFSVIESESAIIDFTPIVHFADPNSITVDVDRSRIGNYVFILDDGEPQTSHIFDNVAFGEHTVTVRDLNGCMDVTKNVFVFDIPKFFTPNNDIYFDTWHIVGVNQLPGTIVYIYNRHGKLLKSLSHISMGWDGTYNGEKMPSDDYWFVAEVIQDGNASQIKGHFTLKR